MDESSTDRFVLVYNARVWRYKLPELHWFCFSAVTGRITRVGVNQLPAEIIVAAAECLDLQGARVFPGLHESHIHVKRTGQRLHSLQLEGCASIQELQGRLREYAGSNPESSWLVGGGWEHDRLGRYPTRADLDAVCPDRPVLLYRVCCHIAVASSKALQIAGITKDSATPSGGEIDRFPESHDLAGEPTGILREMPALDLLTAHMRSSRPETLHWVRAGLQLCLRHGVTAVHSIDDAAWWEYGELAREGVLPIRVFFSAMCNEMDRPNFPRHAGDGVGPLLSCDRVKIFADGALGAATSALSCDYKHQHQRGLLLHTQESLTAQIARATAAGYRLEIHVIGDRAAEAAIEALERVGVTEQQRPILTHCQILRADLIPRIRALGVIANIQPQFVSTDSRWLAELLPESLLPWAYAWKSLIDSGIVCAGGSDSPVETPQPFLGIYEAIYRPEGRRDADNQPTFRPEECLSVEEAIHLYTGAGAYTARREHDLGAIAPGYFADFVVLENQEDPVSNPKLFLTATATQVWVAGERRL